VFVSEVYPDCKDDVCNKQRDDELKNSKVKAKIFTGCSIGIGMRSPNSSAAIYLSLAQMQTRTETQTCSLCASGVELR